MLLLDGQVHHDTHAVPMGNYVIGVGNYVIATPSELGNYMSADNVRDEARRREINLVVLLTAEAISELARASADTNAILHLTC